MATASTSAARVDADSSGWTHALRAGGPARHEAVAALRALLLRAARFEVSRRGRSFPAVPPDELERLAAEAAETALARVLASLDDFSGVSRFETWAAKFAIVEAGIRVRTHAWRNRELPTEVEAPLNVLPDRLRNAIAEALTPEQLRVVVALVFDGVPIDVLAERLETTRAALYETLSDGRRALRERLGETVLGLVPEAG